MRNLSMLTDFYQLSMMQGYLNSELDDDQVVFDLFFRINSEFVHEVPFLSLLLSLHTLWKNR